MNVIHITPNTDGYEIVELIANNVNKTNSLAVIKKDGTLYYTGGIILNDDPIVRKILDPLPKNEQYAVASMFKYTPFVKAYYEN
jgi:hypothetical protein